MESHQTKTSILANGTSLDKHAHFGCGDSLDKHTSLGFDAHSTSVHVLAVKSLFWLWSPYLLGFRKLDFLTKHTQFLLLLLLSVEPHQTQTSILANGTSLDKHACLGLGVSWATRLLLFLSVESYQQSKLSWSESVTKQITLFWSDESHRTNTYCGQWWKYHWATMPIFVSGISLVTRTHFGQWALTQRNLPNQTHPWGLMESY